MSDYDKNIDFVNRLIGMTMLGNLNWKHYYDGEINFKDEQGVFFHNEFCVLDASKSYYTFIEDTFIILAYEINESGKDDSYSKDFRILIGEQGKHGYISQIKFNTDPCALLSELSYHIKDSISDSDEKADAFIDSFLKIKSI